MSELNRNLEKAEQLFRPYRDAPLPHFINGQPSPGSSGQLFEVTTPVDNSVIGKVHAGSAEDIDAACTAASNAFEGWRDITGTERKKLLHRIADAIV
ncbi:MAG TPA: aldehyde dehydrogenase family protein, partial [Xanthomonadales bacterium]|nr:aldehyde dehydrogenase family protein [Xanthomonadales bacterium]